MSLAHEPQHLAVNRTELDSAKLHTVEEAPAVASPPLRTSLKSRFRVAALVASSALLGGIAVVVWNRRALEHMREAKPSRAPGAGMDDFI